MNSKKNYSCFSVFIFLCIVFNGFSHDGIKKGYHFTENKGQFNTNVLFQSKLTNGNLFLEKDRFTFDFYSANELDSVFKIKHSSREKKNGIPEIRKKDRSNPLIPEKQVFKKHSYSMVFEGANLNPKVTSEYILNGFKNYYIGNDRSKWVNGARSFKSVNYNNIYEQIDMEIYSEFEWMKYDFTIHPGGDPNDIRIKYEGVDELIVENGDLIIGLSTGEVKEVKLRAYQTINGERKSILCNFNIEGNYLKYIFPDGYDKNHTLVIDPIWIFSTLSGSTADNWGFTATYDTLGNLYAAGIAFGNGYPATSGSYSTSSLGGDFDISITKFNPTGTSVLYATYLGGNDNEMPHSLVHDSQNHLVMLGTSSSTNYPYTSGVYDQTFNSGWIGVYANMWGYAYNNSCDMVISKLDDQGALIASTYIGGSDDTDGLNETMVYNYSDQVRGEIVLDGNDNVYVTASVWSDNFPVTNGSQINNGNGWGYQDAIVFKMNSSLTTLLWSTYLGGSLDDAGYSIRVSPQGKVFVCGGTTSSDIGATSLVYDQTFNGVWDGYIASFDANSGSPIARTYLGTTDYDQAFILELDDQENVYVVGQSLGGYPVNFVIGGGSYSVPNSSQFIHKLAPALDLTFYSTVFGSGSTASINISPTAFLVDNCGNVYVSGWGGGFNSATSSGAYNPFAGGNTNGMPTTLNAQQGSTDGSDFYFFVMQRDATGLLYGTYLGDNTTAEHTDGGTSRFDPKGVVYQSVCAACNTGLFPTTPGVAYTTSGTAGQPFLCNLGAIKFEFDFQGVVANADNPGNITLCSSPYIVNFSAGSNPPSQAFWDFGDGNTSITVNPSHTYADTGTYQIMYVAIEPSSCNISDTSYFDVTLIAAEQFSAQINIPPPDPCDDTMFVDLLFTGSGADSLIWDMGDGTIIYNDTLFTYYYTTPGSYTITMTAFDFQCNNTGSISQVVDFTPTYSYAQATAPPNVFLCDPPFNVDFSTPGTPPPDCFWDFGDGLGTSTLNNVTYTYADTGTYQVMYIAIDSSTCNIADTAYFTVQLDQAEQFSATFNIPIPPPCSSLDSLLVQLVFTGTGADSIVWDMGDGSVFIDSTSITYYYTSQGTYPIEIIAYDLICNHIDTIRDTVIFITNYSYAQATAPPNVFLCDPPFNVDFSTPGTPPPDCFWDFGDGLGTSTLNNVTYTYADTGTYQVMYIAIDSSTCNIADTAYFTVQLDQAEQFSATFNIPIPPPCSSLDSLLVQLVFTGTGADSIVWDMGDGSVFIDSTSITYYYTSQGTYPIEIIAYDLICNHIDTIRDTVIFITNYSYAQATAPPNVFLCDPPFNVDFSTPGTPPPDCFWDFGDGLGTSTLNNITYTYADTGTYQVMYIAIDSSTCNIADTAYFTVQLDQAEQFSATFNIPIPPPCSSLDSLLVQLVFTGTGADSIVWDMGDGSVFIDSTSITYYYTSQGTYPIEIIAYDLICNHIDTIRDTVIFITNYSYAQATAPPNVFLCDPPFNVDFSTPGTPPPDCFWDFGDGLGTSTLNNITYTYADTGTYQVMYIAIDSSTCNIADTAYFTVQLDQAEQFSAQINIPTPDPCTDSMLVSLTFTGTGADSLIWDLGDGTIIIDSLSVNHYYTIQGTYPISLIAYDLTCNHVDTIFDTAVFISNFSYAQATAPPNVTLCNPPFDVNFTSTGTPPPPDCYWDFGDGIGTSTLNNVTYTYADTGTYQVMYIAIDSSTCNIADTAYFTVQLEIEEQLSAIFDIPVIDPCTDTNQMLVQLAFTGTGADSIVWDMGDGSVFYDSLSISYIYTTQGTYFISMTAYDTTCNNVATFTDTVIFNISYSEAIANAAPNIFACDPPYDVNFNAGPNPPPDNFWNFDDGNTSILPNPVHTFTDTGFYSIMYVAIDSSTCNIADTVYLSVEILQSKEFSVELDFDPPPPCGSDSMLVELTFTGTGADSLIWDMDNGNIFYDTLVNYYYTTPGSYEISLTAFDTLCNKVETISETVYYAGNFHTDNIIPNIFTPNNDGENDQLTFIKANDTKEFSITIFTRWGGVIYQSHNANISWDGTNPGGQNASNGIYYYEIKYIDICSEEEILETGFIHLIR